MKRLVPGKDPINFWFQGKCLYCNCVCAFQKSEGKVTLDQRDGDFISIKCPSCPNGRINVALSEAQEKEPQ